MKKYKLIKWYPSLHLIEVGSTVEQKEECGDYFSLNNSGRTRNIFKSSEIENNPEFWEEVVEKDYEILSFKGNISKKIWKKDSQFKDTYVLKDGIKPFNSLKDMLNHPFLLSIYSVKRLSDGEVFTIENRVKYKGDNYTISRFKTLNEKGLVELIGIQHLTYLNEIQHIKNPLFTTEDGVDIFEGDKFTTVLIDKLILMDINETANSKILIVHPNYKYFSTKEAAEQYILMNKPCLLSINDIKFLQTILDFELVKSLKKVVKSKL